MVLTTCIWCIMSMTSYFKVSFSDDTVAADFKTALLSCFDGTDDGLVTKYVGIDVSQNATYTHLTQEA